MNHSDAFELILLVAEPLLFKKKPNIYIYSPPPPPLFPGQLLYPAVWAFGARGRFTPE